MAQTPMISIPKKTTEEVDWTTPIRNTIAQSYGESPDNYAAECAALQRCRQDAVRGAGSDMTARDLLYKYFGQLELLELRFSEIRVNFPWHDAFTSKLITQTSIAYEKASILFQIAVTHSAIATSQSRSDPEGLKRAFYYFRTCAGMLSYINENFLHAPSTDLSREVVKFLIELVLAQATEVFLEKTMDDKKGSALVSKIAAQAAGMYASLNETVKEFMGKGIFDRNWVALIQIKSKFYSSLAQYHRGLVDNVASKHGDALARFTLSESLAKEAHKSSTAFSTSFVSNLSPNLPPDSGSSMLEKAKAQLVMCTDRKNEGQRENDMIYNAVVPVPEALAAIDKLVVATPIHIHDVYGAPDVQKTIGQDFFIRLVPLSVHESASVYSEEKAKLVRAEVENAESAEVVARSTLDGLGVKEGLVRYKAMAEGTMDGGEEVPLDVRRWKEDIARIEERDGVDGIMKQLTTLKENVSRDLHGVERELEIESRECEAMRVKYQHLWTQDPSAGPSKSLRQDLKSHLSALEAAAASDAQVQVLWDSARSDIQLLLSPNVEQVFHERAGSNTGHLLDLDVGSENDDAKERQKIKGYVVEIEERLGRLAMISKERNEVLKDLKDKVQSDDVSHLLLLNRRNTGVEPALFAAELEKFRPYQQRLASTVHHQDVALSEVTTLWKGLKELAGRGAGARKWEEREKRKVETVKRFGKARDGYMEVRDGLAKGLQFYTDLTELTVKLGSATRSFVSERTNERQALAGKLEAEKRLSAAAATSPPPPLAAKPPLLPPPPFKPYTLDGAFDAMNLGRGSPQQTQQQWQNNGATPSSPPPPPVPNRNSYANPPQQQPPAPYGVSPPPPGPSPYTQYPAHKPTPPPPPSSPPRSSFFPPPPAAPSFSSMSQPGQDPYANLGGFLSTESYTPTRRQSVPPHGPWQSVPPQPPWQTAPPQPPSGQGVPPQPQGALPPSLGQNVLQGRLPTIADLDRRQPPPPRPFPAGVSPVQSPPQPPQQPHQQQQQQGYGQRAQLPGDGFYHQPQPDIFQRGSATGYGGQGQYGNTGTRQYTPGQMFESLTPSQQYWGQNPGQPLPGEYGPR